MRVGSLFSLPLIHPDKMIIFLCQEQELSCRHAYELKSTNPQCENSTIQKQRPNSSKSTVLGNSLTVLALLFDFWNSTSG